MITVIFSRIISVLCIIGGILFLYAAFTSFSNSILIPYDNEFSAIAGGMVVLVAMLESFLGLILLAFSALISLVINIKGIVKSNI